MRERSAGKTVVIVATLDTKGEQVEFVRNQLHELGVATCVVDSGLQHEPRAIADISRKMVAEAAGAPLEEIRSQGRAGVITMAKGAGVIVLDLYAQGRLDAIMGIGGGQNTTIATTVMQLLPIGVPKLMVSTMAAGKMTFGPFVGTKDVTLMYSVADVAGDNAIIRQVLTNAAHAIAGMAQASERVRPSGRPTIATTMLGVTTPCVELAARLLEQLGYEVVTFHANGAGGQAMEELIREGFFQGVLDLTTHELSNSLHDGWAGAPNRLKAAAEVGIPQVVAPGAIEMLSFGRPETIPGAYQGRSLLIHNSMFSAIRLNSDEMCEAAEVMAERLNSAKGPISVVLPTRGFCEMNRPGRPLYGPEADNAFITTLREALRPDIPVVKLDAHMNDPIVAETAVEQLHLAVQAQSRVQQDKDK